MGREDASRTGFTLVELPVVSKREAFTLVELLIVIAILSILVAMLAPSLKNALEVGRRARCLAHLGLLAKSQVSYTADNRQYLPGFAGIVDLSLRNTPWGRLATYPTATGLLHKGGYTPRAEIWLCPSVEMRCPGTFYEENAYPGWYGGAHWTPQEIRAYPFTYHYTVNGRSCFKQICDTWVWGTPLPLAADGSEWAADTAGRRTYQRRMTTFANMWRTILLAEENTGKVPWDGQPYGVGSEVINDPRFMTPDVTEPRHLGKSMACFLDGHAEQIPARVNVELDQDYWP